MTNPLFIRASHAIEILQRKIAAETTAREFAAHPELETRYGPIGREKSLQDANYHLINLGESIAAENAGLFVDYVGQVKIMLVARGIRSEDLEFHLKCMIEALREYLPSDIFAVAAGFLEASLGELPKMPEDIRTFMEDGLPLGSLAQQYLQALLEGNRYLASQLILDAADGGIPIKDIYLHVFQRAQREIGRLWQMDRINVGQEHYCSSATQRNMTLLSTRVPMFKKCNRSLVATAIAGEMHEIGIRMVSDFFEMQGWDTYYLGANTPTYDLLKLIHKIKPDLLAVSACILYHVKDAKALIFKIRCTPDLTSLKIIVGGYPFKVDPDLWRKIGADGTSPDAENAVNLAGDLLVHAPMGHSGVGVFS